MIRQGKMSINSGGAKWVSPIYPVFPVAVTGTTPVWLAWTAIHSVPSLGRRGAFSKTRTGSVQFFMHFPLPARMLGNGAKRGRSVYIDIFRREG